MSAGSTSGDTTEDSEVNKQLFSACDDADNDNVQAVKEAVRRGANVNCTDSIESRTPLMRAALHGHKNIMRVLLDHPDIRINQGNSSNLCTPLHYAAARGHPECVKMLLDAGADVNIVSRWNVTPFQHVQYCKADRRDEVIAVFQKFLALQTEVDDDDAVHYGNSNDISTIPTSTATATPTSRKTDNGHDDDNDNQDPPRLARAASEPRAPSAVSSLPRSMSQKSSLSAENEDGKLDG